MGRTDGSELSQAWDYENLDNSGSCEDEETWAVQKCIYKLRDVAMWEKGVPRRTAKCPAGSPLDSVAIY